MNLIYSIISYIRRINKLEKILNIHMLAQPNDVTCGPTSLHAVYSYLKRDYSLDHIIGSVNSLKDGGTLAVYLGLDAINRGFSAVVHSYNLRLLDPSWNSISSFQLAEKLKLQKEYKEGKKFSEVSDAYISFINAGGVVDFEDLSADLLKRYIFEGSPVLAGLNATYLYEFPRERTLHNNKTVYDDIKGTAAGHFVVICGYKDEHFYVADPYRDNPFSDTHLYSVHYQRLLNAIMLGIITYDANLLVIRENDTSKL